MTHSYPQSNAVPAPVSRDRKVRICLPTSRALTRKTFQCGTYEAQDVLALMEDVDLISFEPESGYERKTKWQRRLLYRDFTKRLIRQNPGLKKITLQQDYDLFAVVCQNYWDLPYLNAIRGWKDHCRVSVCWLDELWACELPRFKHWLHVLNDFDHVFICQRGSVDALSDALGRRCHWLPSAVDTIRFSPFPDPPQRSIDLYYMGRRWEPIHRSLLQRSRESQFFYVYDTMPVAFTDLYDHRQHRDLFANIAKRSRFFMVAPGKMNVLNETRGQIELGYRYCEGAAAGTVMIGSVPDTDAFRELFPWKDAVIPVKDDGTDIDRILTQLYENPARLDQIGRHNAAQALLRHDWVYRWQEIFRIAGIEQSPGMSERALRLKNLSALALGNSTL